MTQVSQTYRDKNENIEFTHETVERALEIHRAAGLIRAWQRMCDDASGTRRRPLYVVTTADGHCWGLRDVWEAKAFVVGLASAAEAARRKAETAS